MIPEVPVRDFFTRHYSFSIRSPVQFLVLNELNFFLFSIFSPRRSCENIFYFIFWFRSWLCKSRTNLLFRFQATFRRLLCWRPSDFSRFNGRALLGNTKICFLSSVSPPFQVTMVILSSCPLTTSSLTFLDHSVSTERSKCFVQQINCFNSTINYNNKC